MRDEPKVSGNPPTEEPPIHTKLLTHDKAKAGLAKQLPIDQLLDMKPEKRPIMFHIIICRSLMVN